MFVTCHKIGSSTSRTCPWVGISCRILTMMLGSGWSIPQSSGQNLLGSIVKDFLGLSTCKRHIQLASAHGWTQMNRLPAVKRLCSGVLISITAPWKVLCIKCIYLLIYSFTYSFQNYTDWKVSIRLFFSYT